MTYGLRKPRSPSQYISSTGIKPVPSPGFSPELLLPISATSKMFSFTNDSNDWPVAASTTQLRTEYAVFEYSGVVNAPNEGRCFPKMEKKSGEEAVNTY